MFNNNNNNNNNNNTQIYLTSAMIQIKVKTPKLIANALGKESSSCNVKCCCKKSSLKQFFNISVEAGGDDSEKQSHTTLGKPFYTRGALLEKSRSTVTVLPYGKLNITPFESDLRARTGKGIVTMDLRYAGWLVTKVTQYTVLVTKLINLRLSDHCYALKLTK